MPNPFFKKQLATSTEPPNRYDPIPDAVVESKNNRPYIGSIDHGVDADYAHFNDMLTTDINDGSDEGVEYEVEKDESPIPVRIVHGESAQEIKGFRVYRTYSPIGNAAQIINRQDNRTGLKIKNLGKNRVWLGESANTANASFGYPLDPGSETSFTTTQAIYGVTEYIPGNGGFVSLLPRGTYSGNADINGTARIDATSFTNCRLYLRVYSMTGTAPSVNGALRFNGMNDAQYGTIASTPVRTTPGLISTTISNIDVPEVFGAFALTAGSADQTIDAELYAYFKPNTSNADTGPCPLAIESDFSVTV